jgi:hypothetical protein
MFAVAPAVNHWPFDFMQEEIRPLTIVQGTADEIVPFAAVADWVRILPNASFHAVEGAGHFFPNQMEIMTKSLLQDVREMF